MKLRLFCFALQAISFTFFTSAQKQQSVDTIPLTIDGHKMFFFASGKGSPTVIMEAGLGATHRCWQAVDTQVAKMTKVVTYDRPGYGISEICKQTRDARTNAKELKTALEKAGILPPYILVGWSLGGSFIRVFCGQYPELVKGLILVDPAPENAYERFEKEHPELMAEDSAYMNEILRSNNKPGEKAEVIAFDKTMLQAAGSDSLHSAETILLIAAGGNNRQQSNPLNRIWLDELKKWGEKRPNLRYKIIENSGHHMAKDQPIEVVRAIAAMLNLKYPPHDGPGGIFSFK
jgi:pimeloyl-ACP methyl ester carboxylesterase